MRAPAPCAAPSPSRTRACARRRCGWAPEVATTPASGGVCISGTPDYPSEEVFVAQWETKGCEDCPIDGPRSQCYRASYNEKNHFQGSGNWQNEYAVLPANTYPAHHPVVTRGRQPPRPESDAPEACDQIPANDWWASYTLETPSQTDDLEAPESLPGAVVFFAYNYPTAYSSNTGYEASESMVTFLVQGDDCDSYLVVLLDNPATSHGGYAQLELVTTGLTGVDLTPTSFQNDPQYNTVAAADHFDSLEFDGTDSYTAKWKWAAEFNDGGVFGPLPMSGDWSVTMSLVTKETRGLDSFKIGTWDSDKCDMGFITAPIKHSTEKWGGIRFDSMECTEWCQRYSSCSSCAKDDQCQFYNGQCIAADAYVYDYGCARPSEAPVTKMMQRWGEAWDRESENDGCDSVGTIRFGLPSGIDMTCECTNRYRYWVTVYDESMNPVYKVENVEPRLDYEYTFVDLCLEDEAGNEVLTHGNTYYVYSYLCVAQGTLGRDDCSPVQIDTVLLDVSPPSPSPPAGKGGGR